MRAFLQALMRREAPTRSATVTEQAPPFNWEAYRDTYVDLGHFTSAAEAWRHFEQYGLAEGRLSTAGEVAARLAALQDEHGPLPPDFDWKAYRASEPQLAMLRSSYEAAEHYLKHGRAAGAIYRHFDASLYRDLYLPGAAISGEQLKAHYREIGRARGFVTNLSDLATTVGIEPGAWLEALNVDEFRLLNAHWAGPIANARDALTALQREGFQRLAPINLRLVFDPAYYREANPGQAGLADAALYRNWLVAEVPNGRPGWAADHLARHGLRLNAFPEAFDWARYAAMPGVYGDTRWALLDHLVANNGIAAADVPLKDGDAAGFLAALAVTIAGRLAARGEALFAEAARHGALTGAEQARWAEALGALDRWSEAFDHLLEAHAADPADVPIVVAGVRAALKVGRHADTFDLLASTRATSGGDATFHPPRPRITHSLSPCRSPRRTQTIQPPANLGQFKPLNLGATWGTTPWYV